MRNRSTTMTILAVAGLGLAGLADVALAAPAEETMRPALESPAAMAEAITTNASAAIVVAEESSSDKGRGDDHDGDNDSDRDGDDDGDHDGDSDDNGWDDNNS